MGVSTTATTLTYTGNGSTTAFGFPDYLYQKSDLTVQVTDNSGNITTKVLGVDYNINDTADTRLGTYPNGVTVTFVSAPTAGYTILLSRATARVQTTTFVDNDPFPSATIEDALDRLTAIAQEGAANGRVKGLIATPPTAGTLGDIWYNVNPVPGGNIGWVCTTGGSPATWCTFGAIEL